MAEVDNEKAVGSSAASDVPSEREGALNVAPDGGIRAWLVVLGGFLTYFATFGFLNSYGTFQAFYQDHHLRGTSPSAISWIGSLQLFLLFIGGIVIGPIFDAHGSKVLFWPGTVIYVLSMVLTSLATEYYQLMLAQGVMLGVGNAMLFYPTISAISQWFDRRRGYALGVVMAGSCLGGIVWPISIERMIATIGFPWAMRVSALVCLLVLLPSCFLVVPRVAPRAPSEASGVRLKGIFADSRYTLLTAGFFFVFWGMFIPFYYLTLYGQFIGMSSFAANNLLPVLNAGSFIGRIASGLLADKLGRFNVTYICALVGGILLLCLHAVTTAPCLVVFSVFYGFLSGGLISLQPACVAQITKSMEMIGLNIGVMMAICSFGVLTGSPIGGAFMAADDGGFEGFITFSGVILLFGSFLVFCSRLAANRDVLKVF
ncbi:MAG: hypothetical protein M1817_000830 [Caeruleum heppii]|nr:MAG: hypothetical protein M1817_000830 [Caeruleum heppii]